MRIAFGGEGSLILKMCLAHGFMSRCGHGDQRWNMALEWKGEAQKCLNGYSTDHWHAGPFATAG